MKPVKIGFIGCGGHSKRHADVVSKMPDLYEIVGAVDITQGVARNFLLPYVNKDNPRALATTSVSRFFEIDGLEAVLIGTPHQFHLDYSIMALEQGKHVLCEKPLWEGPRLAEAQDMLALAEKRGLLVSSCHLRRFERPYMHVARNLTGSGGYLERFGNAVEVRFQFFYHEPSTKWKMDDSLLLDHMNHEIDLVHFLFGESPATFWRVSHSFDEYRVAGKTKSGLGIWFSGYRRLKGRTFRNELELIFERGRVKTESVLNSETGLVEAVVFEQSFEDDNTATTHFHAHSYDESLIGVMRNFALAIRGVELLYLTHKDLLTNTNICNELVANEYASI
jgi:predicted dehydrogenase